MTDIKLKVPYFSQNDNDSSIFGPGYRQCNLTSNSMVLDFLTKGDLSRRAKANGYSEAESYLGSKLAPYGDTTDSNAITKCLLNEFNIKNEFRMTLSTKDLEKQLQKGFPIPIGVKYKSGGHYVVVVGIDEEGWLVHDPYGIRNGSSDSYNIGAYAAYDRYSFGLLNEIWLDSNNSNSGWGRIFY